MNEQRTPISAIPTPPSHGGPRHHFAARVPGGPTLEGGPALEAVPEETTATIGHTPLRPDGPYPPEAPHGQTDWVADGYADYPDPPEAHTGIDSRVPASSTIGYHLAAINLHKSYQKGSLDVPVLQGVSLGVRRGEFLAVVGKSGCGKSTLLHLLGTLDRPDSGQIDFNGRRIDDLPAVHRDSLRNGYFGMIFQFYYLLPELTTLENVLAPLMIAENTWGFLTRRRQHRKKAAQLLEMVGLGHRLKHKPRELSGGEMQRAAIARALVAGPQVLLADEPTGNLDETTGGQIMEILHSLNREQNLTIVMVTHDLALADQADRVIRLTGGQIEAS